MPQPGRHGIRDAQKCAHGIADRLGNEWRHGIPDEFVPVGPPAALYAHYKLDVAGIVAVAREALTAGKVKPVAKRKR